MRFRIYCAVISLLLSSVVQAQEDPYLEWLKKQGGQQQTPAPESPYPIPAQTLPPQPAPEPVPRPQPPPPPPPKPVERELYELWDGSGYNRTNIVIVGSRLEIRETYRGKLGYKTSIPIDDIRYIENEPCMSAQIVSQYENITVTRADGSRVGAYRSSSLWGFNEAVDLSKATNDKLARFMADALGVRIVTFADGCVGATNIYDPSDD